VFFVHCKLCKFCKSVQKRKKHKLCKKRKFRKKVCKVCRLKEEVNDRRILCSRFYSFFRVGKGQPYYHSLLESSRLMLTTSSELDLGLFLVARLSFRFPRFFCGNVTFSQKLHGSTLWITYGCRFLFCKIMREGTFSP
jgi:hypothetical protein